MKRHTIVIFSGVFYICLDQILKQIARLSESHPVYIIDQLIGWEYFENPGIAFGIPVPQFIVLPLSILIVILGLYHLQKIHHTRKQIIGIALITAGAISNLIDRIIYGITIDYIRIFTSILNIADIAIIIGAIFIITKDASARTQNSQ